MTWVALTLLAALMQAIRTAGQKRLAESLDVIIVSWVRFLFGLPFALLLFMAVLPDDFEMASMTPKYWLYVVIISVGQLFATLSAVILLGRRNFAIGSTLVKSEAIFTAILGAVLFAEYLSLMAWFAVILGIVGLFVSSLGKFNLKIMGIFAGLDSKSALLGLAGGFMFAIASVYIRQANLLLASLDAPMTQAVITLTCVLIFQTLFGGLVVILFRKNQIKTLFTNFNACVFIGLTSMLGSFGWFSAYALQNSAYVKTLGQCEFVFTLLLTWFYFKEKIKLHEYMAMALIGLSALLIIWSK